MEKEHDQRPRAGRKVAVDGSGAWQKSYDAGMKSFASGNYAEAAERFETARKDAEPYGSQDARFLLTLNALAGAYSALGQHTEAGRIYTQALSLQEAASGPHSAALARTLNGLGTLYSATGRLDDAEASYRRALKVQEGPGGSEDLGLATTLNNLAILYKAQRRFPEALSLFERAMRIALKVSGPDHQFVATALNNVGSICLETGRHGQAEALFKQALEIKERVHGSHHPEVATVLNNLGDLYCASGRPEEARPVYARVLAMDELVYGANHLEVAADLMQLGSACQACGDAGAAREHYHRALDIRQVSLGAHHALTEEAKEKVDQLPGFKRSAAAPSAEAVNSRPGGELITAGAAERGVGRPAAAQSLCELAERCARERRWTEAERIYGRELEIERSVAGSSAASVSATLNNIGCVRYRQGGAEQAAAFFQESLGAWLGSAKPLNALAAIALNNLAVLCAARSRFAEAKSLYARSLQIETDPSPSDGGRWAMVAANLAALAKPAEQGGQPNHAPQGG